MLKKNPSTVETVKRLRRYVGNIKDWNFDEIQSAEFNEKAIKIRKLAEIIYKNFKVIFNVDFETTQFSILFIYLQICTMQKLFNYNYNDTFWQSFSDDVELFKQQTKELSRNDLLKLTVEPGEQCS